MGISSLASKLLHTVLELTKTWRRASERFLIGSGAIDLGMCTPYSVRIERITKYEYCWNLRVLQTVFYEHYGLDTWHRSCDIRLKGHTKSSCVASFFFVIEVNDTYTLQATCNQIPFVFVEKITRCYRLLLPCSCGFRTVMSPDWL